MRELNATVFSAKPYVFSFLRGPLTATFPKASFIDAALDVRTAELAKGSEVVCLFVNDACDAHVVDVLADGGVKLIAMRCAGHDRVDVEHAARRGIRVVNVPTYSPTSVAEFAVALMFCLNRKLHSAHDRVVQGNYALSGLVGFECFGKTVGVLGTGAIGAEAVRCFHGLGMKVLAYDIRPNPKVEALGVPYLPMDEILPQCDVVSIHVPLLPATHRFFNAQKIALLKPGCMVINVSRGALVDSAAALDGIESGQIGALGMDVYENEAELYFVDWTAMDPKERIKHWDRTLKVLQSYPQVVLTPHTAFLTHEALANIAAATVDNITAWLDGRELVNEVKAS